MMVLRSGQPAWRRLVGMLVVGGTLGACGLAAQSGSAGAQDAAEDAGGRPEVPDGTYDKPHLKRLGRQVAVGGYIDHELEWRDDGSGVTFDQHRLVPFITSEISDRVHVSTEIELEHGGFVKGSGSSDGEIKIEYAVLDFRISEAISFRGGVILSPLGMFNLLHDSPLNDLTERPTVDREIIPTTLSESGMGFFGTLYPSELSVLSYEIYLVNGFDEDVIDGDGRLRLRGGRGSKKEDNNENKAIAARIGFSPRLGISLGGSIHSGDYDDSGRHNLSIVAVDARVTRGTVEALGEFALAAAEIDRVEQPTAADRQYGAYAQVNVHVGHDLALPGSVFTVVARGDWVDFDADRNGDREEGITLGLNFRPVEDTVFKLDYGWTWKTPVDGARGVPMNRLFFSLASYF